MNDEDIIEFYTKYKMPNNISQEQEYKRFIERKQKAKEIYKKYAHKYVWKDSWDDLKTVKDLDDKIVKFLDKAKKEGGELLGYALYRKFSKRIVAAMKKIVSREVKSEDFGAGEKKQAVAVIRTISKTLVPNKTEEIKAKIQKIESAPPAQAKQLILATTDMINKESAKVQKKAEVILKKVKSHKVGKTYSQQEAKTKKIKAKKPGSASCRYVRVYTIGGVKTSKSTSKKISVEDFKKLQAIIKEKKKNK